VERSNESGRRSGAEPVTALSALGLRAVLSWGAGIVFAVLAGLLLVLAPSGSGRSAFVLAAVFCLAIVVVAAIDLVVIQRRRSRRERGSSEGDR